MRKLTASSQPLWVLPLLAMFALSGCSKSSEPQAQAPIKQNFEFTAVGYAAMETQQGESDDIKMLNAIKASKLEAYKELAEQVYGVMLTSESSIKNNQLSDGILQTKVTGLVRGAKVLRSYHEGDLYITELALNMETLPFLEQSEFYKEEETSEEAEVINVKQQVYY